MRNAVPVCEHVLMCGEAICSIVEGVRCAECTWQNEEARYTVEVPVLVGLRADELVRAAIVDAPDLPNGRVSLAQLRATLKFTLGWDVPVRTIARAEGVRTLINEATGHVQVMLA
jgi:hypothetical protein